MVIRGKPDRLPGGMEIPGQDEEEYFWCSVVFSLETTGVIAWELN